MNLVWGKTNLHIKPGTPHSNRENDSGLRIGPRRQDLPFPQPPGNCGTDTDLSPLIVFTSHELSMNYARSALLPSGPKTFAGRRQNSSQSPWLYKAGAGFRCAPASWAGQTWAYVTSLLLFLLLQSCLVNTSPLQINALCRWPADLCLVPGFISIVLRWWC